MSVGSSCALPNSKDQFYVLIGFWHIGRKDRKLPRLEDRPLPCVVEVRITRRLLNHHILDGPVSIKPESDHRSIGGTRDVDRRRLPLTLDNGLYPSPKRIGARGTGGLELRLRRLHLRDGGFLLRDRFYRRLFGNLEFGGRSELLHLLEFFLQFTVQFFTDGSPLRCLRRLRHTLWDI